MVREGDLDDLTPRPRHNFGWGSDATGNHDKNMRLLKGLALRRRCTEEGSVIFRCVVAIYWCTCREMSVCFHHIMYEEYSCTLPRRLHYYYYY